MAQTAQAESGLHMSKCAAQRLAVLLADVTQGKMAPRWLRNLGSLE